MKTNQMMTVQIGLEHIIQIGHLTKMGNLNDVLKIGNLYRKEKGFREIGLDEYLRRNETWEFINEVERKYGDLNSKREIPVLEFDSKNRVIYSNAISNYTVIRSQKGGKPENRGVWANLQIMLDLAIYLSPTLRLEMIDIFIENKLLEWRDSGGENFKELNALIDTFPDRIGKNNQQIYINTALLIRKKLDILDTRGYNEKDHDSFIQRKRTKWQEQLISAIELGFITSVEQLHETILKLK